MRTFAPQRQSVSLYCKVPANPACACARAKSLKVKPHTVKARLKPFHHPLPRHDLDFSVKHSP